MRVALTFDAEHPSRSHCPPGVQEALLEELANRGLRATFFVQGRWAKAYPQTARAIAAAGHLIGNHSHYHARMSLLSDEGLRIDVLEGVAASGDEAIVLLHTWPATTRTILGPVIDQLDRSGVQFVALDDLPKLRS
jgi:hypothetical protein